MLVSPLPPSFLDTYSLSMSSLGCNAFCMVISFLVLWSICLSSSLNHFKNGPKYLTKGTSQVFIPLIRFLVYSFVLSSFLVLPRYSFLSFSFISSCLMIFPSICRFPVLQAFYFFSWFSSSISSIMYRFQFFIIRMAHFSLPNSIPMS